MPSHKASAFKANLFFALSLSAIAVFSVHCGSTSTEPTASEGAKLSGPQACVADYAACTSAAECCSGICFGEGGDGVCGESQLLGDPTIESMIDGNAAGQAEAFTYVATSSGRVDSVQLYLDASSAATHVIVGLYEDDGGEPSNLIASGTVVGPGTGSPGAPVGGVFNIGSVPGGALVRAGSTYWVAVLAPVGAGNIAFRDAASGPGTSIVSAETDLTSLPPQWTSGARYPNSPATLVLQSNYAVPLSPGG